MPLPLEKIPAALLMAGRHDEALAWCDTILTRYADRKDVVRVIQRKKDEILAQTGTISRKN